MGPVGELLVESLRALRADVPACHEAARLALAGRATLCSIDDEQFVASFTPEGIVVRGGVQTAEVEVSISRRAILALVRNERSLNVAVMSGELKVRGLIADVAALGRATKAFLHGAVRSPAFPAILARFERLAEAVRE